MMQLAQRRARNQAAHDIGRFIRHGNRQAPRIGRKLVAAIDRVRTHVRIRQRFRQITLEAQVATRQVEYGKARARIRFGRASHAPA